MTTLTDANTVVTAIRHTYRSGTNPVYKATLSLGRLSSLPDYEESLDNLKEELKTENTKAALDIVKQDMIKAQFDKLINHPAEGMSPNPLLQKLWKQGQGTNIPDDTLMALLKAMKINPYNVGGK
jgi:hypothetical protein